jgi:hypothetical protein
MENKWGQMTETWMQDGELVSLANEISTVVHTSPKRSIWSKVALAVTCLAGLGTGIGLACWLDILTR